MVDVARLVCLVAVFDVAVTTPTIGVTLQRALPSTRTPATLRTRGASDGVAEATTMSNDADATKSDMHMKHPVVRDDSPADKDETQKAAVRAATANRHSSSTPAKKLQVTEQSSEDEERRRLNHSPCSCWPQTLFPMNNYGSTYSACEGNPNIGYDSSKGLGGDYAICQIDSTCSPTSSAGWINQPLCGNNCNYARDGVCDDGGPGAQYTDCFPGDDCEDCGTGSYRTSRFAYCSPCTCKSTWYHNGDTHHGCDGYLTYGSDNLAICEVTSSTCDYSVYSSYKYYSCKCRPLPLASPGLHVADACSPARAFPQFLCSSSKQGEALNHNLVSPRALRFSTVLCMYTHRHITVPFVCVCVVVVPLVRVRRLH